MLIFNQSQISLFVLLFNVFLSLTICFKYIFRICSFFLFCFNNPVYRISTNIKLLTYIIEVVFSIQTLELRRWAFQHSLRPLVRIYSNWPFIFFVFRHIYIELKKNCLSIFHWYKVIFLLLSLCVNACVCARARSCVFRRVHVPDPTAHLCMCVPVEFRSCSSFSSFFLVFL